MTGLDDWAFVGGMEDGRAMEMESGKGKGEDKEGEGERDSSSYSSSMDGGVQIVEAMF